MTILGKIFCIPSARLGSLRSTVLERCNFSTKSKMCEFYAGKNIFITGSTGFMGKVFDVNVTCPDVGRVYILVRGKKNNTFSNRLEQLRNEPIFTKYNRVDDKFFSKIVGIEGQFGNNGLQISEKDRDVLREEVNIVFHVASTVRFNEPLDVAMNSIFVGTKSMLSLANDMRQLSSFVYVSTAFANSHLLMPEEIVYDMKIDGDSILSLYENNSNVDVEKMVRKNYFDGRPNTYTFAKTLTENFIRKHYSHLPVAIARPSVVAASLFEPGPGYCDSAAAVSFGVIYQGLGVCRYIPIKNPALVDVIPVDIAINSLLIVAREAGLQATPDINVYNLSSAWHWSLTHKNVADSKLKAIMRSPPLKALRTISRETSEMTQFQQNVINYFSELPFAIFSDTVAKIVGNKNRILKLTRWIQSIRNEQAVFYQNSWVFPRRNMDEAVARLSEEDRKLFPAIPTVNDTDEYFYNYWMSLRELVIGEKADNIDAAHRRQKRLALRTVALCYASLATCAITCFLYIL